MQFIRYILIILVLVKVSNVAMAQSNIRYNEFGRPIPFLYKNSPYLEKINLNDLPSSYKINSYNNDSLLFALNSETSTYLCTSIVVDSNYYDFKELAYEYNLGHGDLWILKLTSPTAQGLSVLFKDYIIPEGALISYYQLNYSKPFRGVVKSYLGDGKTKLKKGFGILGNELIIEYYEPKGISSGQKLMVGNVRYEFSNHLGTNLKEVLKKKETRSDSLLKSGSYGYSDYNCGKIFPCSSTDNWKNVSSSVVFIYVRCLDGSNFLGSGFLINKAGGYSANDKPYILTAGHNLVDGSNADDYLGIECVVNYQDFECNDIYQRRGTYVSDLSSVEFGGSSLIEPTEDDYSPNDDYCLMQLDITVENLAQQNVSYAGWETSFSYSNQNYTVIGHPMGDTKRIVIESITSGYGNDFFYLYNHFGINEHGASGSPVFYSGSKKVVGWVCTTVENTTTCSSGTQYSKCGHIMTLYNVIKGYIDPSLIGSAATSNPTSTVLPDHCHNCIKDDDETGIDCGGSCQPCGMADDHTATTTADIYGREKLNARFDLNVDGGGTPVEFQNQNYVLTAGESVKLKSTKISNGATFKASVNETLMYSEKQGCQDACVSVANVFTPNGDGVNDFFVASLAFVTKYNILIQDSWGTTVFSDNNVPVYDNGVYALWDGDGSLDGYNYKVWLTVTDCYGNQSTSTQILACFKSATVDVNTEILQSVISNDVLLVYPNPASSFLKVELNPGLIEGNNSYFIIINNVSGKTVLQNNFCDFYNEIDISSFEKGTYVLTVETKDKVYSKKFIKN